MAVSADIIVDQDNHLVADVFIPMLGGGWTPYSLSCFHRQQCKHSWSAGGSMLPLQTSVRQFTPTPANNNHHDPFPRISDCRQPSSVLGALRHPSAAAPPATATFAATAVNLPIRRPHAFSPYSCRCLRSPAARSACCWA